MILSIIYDIIFIIYFDWLSGIMVKFDIQYAFVFFLSHIKSQISIVWLNLKLIMIMVIYKNDDVENDNNDNNKIMIIMMIIMII